MFDTEVHRVLKPGGRFYTGMRSRETMRELPFVKFGFKLYSVKVWKKVLDKNGFTFVDTKTQLDPEIES